MNTTMFVENGILLLFNLLNLISLFYMLGEVVLLYNSFSWRTFSAETETRPSGLEKKKKENEKKEKFSVVQGQWPAL